MTIDILWKDAECVVKAVMKKYKNFAERRKVWCSEDDMLGTISNDGNITFRNMGTELVQIDKVFDINKIRFITLHSKSGYAYRISYENSSFVSYDEMSADERGGVIDMMLFLIDNIEQSKDIKIEIEYYTSEWGDTEGFYDEINTNTLFNQKGNVFEIIAELQQKGIEFKLGYYTDR